MAVLPDADRVICWNRFMDESNRAAHLIGVDKVALRAAVNGIDDWIDANAASFNTAIPQPARSALSAKQKTRLLVMLAMRRFEVA